NPDGSFHSPVLPELDEAELAANADRFGFGSSALTKRLALRRQLEELLRASTPVTERRTRPKHAAQPPTAPPAPVSTPASHDAVEKDFSLLDQETGRRGDAAKPEASGSGEAPSNRALRRDMSPIPTGAARSPSSQPAMPQKQL